ncbi:MAG: adenylosuccinate lyase [Candidatus Pacebacteria bacterium]|nr:adenylosuccinate lyase [Candidatus Paceibacterota bacterium]
MGSTPLANLSPLDGRYHIISIPLAKKFSESSLISHRLKVEILYLQFLSKEKIIRSFTKKENIFLNKLIDINSDGINQVKIIEQETRHDVKAVEYYLASKLKGTSLEDCISYIHLGLTSADINNLSYRLMITSAHKEVMLRKLKEVLKELSSFSDQYYYLPMLARTHGQAAIPTTLGKEVSVFGMRLLKQVEKLEEYQLTGKLSGAVGSFQALDFIKPEVDWIKFSTKFIASLGLQVNLHTTQINPADDIVELLNIYHLIGGILIDLNQDMWRYISDDWLVQESKKGQVGSSTMPQKINPIQFENSEGNLTLANGLIETINRKVVVSRLQRDLSDSTINRNYGTIFGYCLISYSSLLRGLSSIKPNKKKIESDLNKNYSILSEALQTYLRYGNDPQAYQKAAKMMKGKNISKEDWEELTKDIDKKLFNLSPSSYIGLASKLTKLATKDINNFLLKT